MRAFLATAVAVSFAWGVFADEPKPLEAQAQAGVQALETFVGTWEIASVQPDGATKDAKRLVFRKDMSYAALDKNGKELWAGTFDLDATATPKIWDHRSHEARKNGGDALGVYQLEGDRLQVACVVGTWKEKQWIGKPRPTKFQLPAADVVLELRRVKGDK
jgi:uncharacterized protein (TIGR03067 family)